NCISIEISLSSKLNDAELWYQQIEAIAKSGVEKSSVEKVQRYRFVYRMTLEDKFRLNLDKQNLKAFQPIPAQLDAVMNVQSPAYPIFIGDVYTPYNYGELLNKINV